MSFLNTIVLQAIARRFHRYADDAVLDRCATECGCCAIGRLSLLDDESTKSLLELCDIRSGSTVLDIGCGRGFIGRWMAKYATTAVYTGVDRIVDAVTAARAQLGEAAILLADYKALRMRDAFDAAIAVELAVDGDVPEELTAAAAAALRPHGAFAATAASLHRPANENARLLAERAAKRFGIVETGDWTQRVAPFAQKMYRWWLESNDWHPAIARKAKLEARTVLDSIESGSFSYAVLVARKPIR